MRTLFDIVEGAKDGNKPTYDECYFAMLALSSLHAMEHAAVNELAGNMSKAKHGLTLKQSFNRSKEAFAVPPDEWLGTNIPGDKMYDNMRRISKAVLQKVIED